MTPALTECIPEQFKFGKVKGRNVIANFQGGRLTSDRGLVLIAELNKKRQITARFASCFTDYRHQGYRLEYCPETVVDQASLATIASAMTQKRLKNYCWSCFWNPIVKLHNVLFST